MKLKEYKKNLKNEYQETFQQKGIQPKKQFQFKIRYAFALAFLLLFAVLIGQHIYVICYNAEVDRFNASLRTEVVNYDTSEGLTSIHSKKEYEAIVTKYTNQRVYRSKQKSILSNLFSFQPIGCTANKGEDLGLMVPDTSAPSTAPSDETNSNQNNSFNTNVQVMGLDEADVAKCDGRYIYYLVYNALYIYDIETQTPVLNHQDSGNELYIYQNRIISIGYSSTSVYEFENNKLVLQYQFEYDMRLDSRLVGENLYLVKGFKVEESNIIYNDCYYDNCSQPRYLYSLVRLNLNTFVKKEIQLLSQSSSILYASDNHFYIAAQESHYTVISIFTFDLEPVGSVRVCGKVLNQFSMDEYNNTFRVVTTDTFRKDNELNAITIFDITRNFERVGYLDQGIGLDRQIVKSVRYDKNTCYVVTYQNTDPLYEIDCSDPTNPVIVSAYKAPGYSNYLHTFVVNEKEYVLGLGFTDSLVNPKISVYENTTDKTTQIGKDFILVKGLPMLEGDYVNQRLHSYMFSNHKALFFYEKEGKLYLGAMVADDAYLIFEIDVNNQEQVVSIYKEIELDRSNRSDARAFLVKDTLYVTNNDAIKVVDFFEN